MKIGLGVSGCIGAYKSALVLRELQKAGAEVRVIMTASAGRFIGETTLEALSGAPVLTDLFASGTNAPIRHIALAREIDLLLVAPATANILAKFAAGICDDALTTVYVSTTSPVVVAPAMNVEMWRHPSTQDNIAVLKRRGVHIVEPEAGYLACGEEGEGRLAEPA
ncbi:MAG: flavoprotein, partial [Acidobacteriota bacterium]